MLIERFGIELGAVEPVLLSGPVGWEFWALATVPWVMVHSIMNKVNALNIRTPVTVEIFCGLSYYNTNNFNSPFGASSNPGIHQENSS